MPNQVDFRGEMPSVVSLRFPGHRILGRVLREVSRQDFDSGGPTTDIGAGDIGAQVRRQQSSSMYLQICGSSGTSKPRFVSIRDLGAVPGPASKREVAAVLT